MEPTNLPLPPVIFGSAWRRALAYVAVFVGVGLVAAVLAVAASVLLAIAGALFGDLHAFGHMLGLLIRAHPISALTIALSFLLWLVAVLSAHGF